MGRRPPLAALGVRRESVREIQMSLWNEITNSALLGCERKPLSLNQSADKLGGLLTQFDQSDCEGALLGTAAVVSLYGRAGSLPSKDTRPSPGACEPDDSPRCNR